MALLHGESTKTWLYGLLAALTLGALTLAPAHAVSAQDPSASVPNEAKEVCWTNHNGRTRERVLNFVTDRGYEPFSYVDEEGELRGIDVDLLKAWAQQDGMTVRICAVNFSDIFKQLKAKQADGAMAGISFTVKRSQYLDFSQSYFAATEAVVASDLSEIKTLDDLKGKTVAVKRGSVGESFALEHQKELDLTIKSLNTSFETMLSVHMGQSDFCIDDYPVAAYQVSTGLYPGLTVAIARLPVDRFCESFHFVAPKSEDKALVKAFNDGLMRLIDSGEYTRIIKSYLKNFAEPMKGPHSVPELELPTAKAQ